MYTHQSNKKAGKGKTKQFMRIVAAEEKKKDDEQYWLAGHACCRLCGILVSCSFCILNFQEMLLL